jgi:hypothetical protein
MPENCILMFSGGRDSTLAAVRLGRLFSPVVLVTVTSGHLIGIEKVRQRLGELRRHLLHEAEWIHVKQPPNLLPETLSTVTCLPCHRAYIAVGVNLARQLAIPNLAFGYAKYQSTWPEQTSAATQRLERLLNDIGIRLLLPVYDICAKEQAIADLVELKMSPAALEQKCLQQQSHMVLSETALAREIDQWEQSTREELRRIIDQDLAILSREVLTRGNP